jgi:hypothetical protein
MDEWAGRAADVPVVADDVEFVPFGDPANGSGAVSGPDELTALRLRLRSNGYHPVPVVGAHIPTNSAGKRPTMTAWETECLNATEAKIESWSGSQPGCTNTGLLCGEIVGVDIDVLDAALSASLVARAFELLGHSPLRRIGRAPKTLLVYRVETPHKKLSTADLFFGDDPENKEAKAKVEILADGQQFVGFGIHPDTRAPYHWPERSPLDTAASDIPLVTLDLLMLFVTEAERILRAAGGRKEREIKDRNKQTETRNREGGIFGGFGASDKPSREDVADALDQIPNDMDYDEWIRVGFALYDGLGDSGRDLWERWSAGSHKNDKDLTARKWPSFARGKSVKIGTLFWLAQQHGWRRSSGSGYQSATRSDGQAPNDVPTTLPVIQIKSGELASLATRAERLLIDAGVQIYQRGGRLVRPIIETVDASRGRKTSVAQLNVLEKVYARDLLSRHAVWEKWDARAKQSFPINPPEEISSTMLARVGDWTFPSIAGVISTPTMRPDGSLLLEAGYDHTTRLLLVEPPSMPAIPDRPTREDAEAALRLIEDLLTGFPFVDDVARACALSAIITPVVRGAFSVTPMHCSRAPTAGSGKSFLWDTVSAIAIGQLMPVMSTGASEEETEKRLGAALMAGQPLISLDNISGELGGDALCQIIERPVVDIRILGRSERVRIEAGGTSVYATGNNFTILGDVCRRAITTNMDPEVERPELRQFDFDPVERVLANRGQYIAAALTVCCAYFAAGRPGRAPRLASFEGWSDTVRSALIWLGKEDPVKSMESARAEDPERIELGDMLEAWGEVIGIGPGSRMRLAVVLAKALGTSRQAEGLDMEPTYPDFHAALQNMAQRSASRTGRSAPPDARMFGKWLQRFKGRIVNGKRFVVRPDEKHGSEWWVELVARG